MSKCEAVWWNNAFGNVRCGQYIVRIKDRVLCPRCQKVDWYLEAYAMKQERDELQGRVKTLENFINEFPENGDRILLEYTKWKKEQSN